MFIFYKGIRQILLTTLYTLNITYSLQAAQPLRRREWVAQWYYM